MTIVDADETTCFIWRTFLLIFYPMIEKSSIVTKSLNEQDENAQKTGADIKYLAIMVELWSSLSHLITFLLFRSTVVTFVIVDNKLKNVWSIFVVWIGTKVFWCFSCKFSIILSMRNNFGYNLAQFFRRPKCQCYFRSFEIFFNNCT